MPRRRLRNIGVLRKVLTYAIGAISILALLAVHLHFHIFPSSTESSYKLPSEIGHQRWKSELSWTQEFAPPQFSKVPPSAQKLVGARGILDFNKLWKPPPSRDFVPCIEPSPLYSPPTESRGYLLVHTNGGLNQMRAGICDMVAVARILNATLVVPELDKRSFWQDTSNFSDVFDEDHFINALANDVKVIKKLPKELTNATRAVKQFRSWSGMDYYQDEIASMWEEYKLLVDRMRSYGPYIALHLRYEKDMLSFSGCTHGLSQAEADELTLIRENTAYWKVKEIDSREQRAKGYCPLTPKEVGMFLVALGYPSTTPIYIAAGDIYGGDAHMDDLQFRFPLLMSKEKLASVEELEPFSCHASQMAALDYIVSVESDVFIPSYSGNMARAVEGHRRFLGHRKTISPDRKALVHLFDRVERGSLKEGKGLFDRIIEIHKRRQGSPRKRKGPISGTRGMDRFRSEEAFYVNPLPDCLCRKDSPSINTSYSIR